MEGVLQNAATCRQSASQAYTDMQTLVLQWRKNYSDSDLIISLYIQKQRYPRLYWRTSRSFFGSQRNVTPFESGFWDDVMAELTRHEGLVDNVVRYERTRLRLNRELRISLSGELAYGTEESGELRMHRYLHLWKNHSQSVGCG